MSIESLDTISKKYKLDKNILFGHDYIPGYESLFESRRFHKLNILEIGIGSVENGQMAHIIHTGYKSGGSVKCWSEYFPNAQIYAMDLYKHMELDTERIKTFVADQSSSKDLLNVVNQINDKLDIIIDDGSHVGEHQAFTFIFLNKYLNKNGIYAIEDVQPHNIEKFKNLSIFSEEMQDYIHENFIVKCFDTRKRTGRGDDFIISFTRKW